MRSILYSILAFIALALGLAPLAQAAAGYTSSDPSGTVSCTASGTCGTITFTPINDGNSYFFEPEYCLTTTPLSSPTPNTVAGYDGGPCSNTSSGFNSSFMSCSQSWNDPCTLDISSVGLPAGTYTVYVYLYYTYCPTSDISGGGCTVGSGGVGYTAIQTVTLSGTVASNTPTVGGNWVPGSWGTCSSGTQTRSVTCQDSSGNILANSDCTGTEPASSQSCTSTSSPSAPACTDPTCTAVNSGPGVTLPNCTPDPSKNQFCIVVPTKQ